MVALGGHVWLLPGGGMCGCSEGGMHGFSWGGACMVFARGRAWFFPGGACVGYDEIRSMSGRYASYWNAFLFVIMLRVFGLVVDIMLNLFLFIVPCFTFVAVSLLPSTDDRR